MDIRFAMPQDRDSIVSLLAQIGQLHYQGRPDIFRQDALKFDEQAFLALLQDKDRPVLVAVEESRVLGYAFCVRKVIQNHPVLADESSLYIDDLCVDEAVRGKGIGTALYEAVVALAKEMGVRRITLNVWAFNESALAFYQKCGMKMQRIFMETPLEELKC